MVLAVHAPEARAEWASVQAGSDGPSPVGAASGLLVVVGICVAWGFALASAGDEAAYDSGLAGFLATWVIMMAAVMLPEELSIGRAYQRTLAFDAPRAARVLRGLGLTFGYLAVWCAIGLLAYAGWSGIRLYAEADPAAATATAAWVLAGLAVYQFPPWKRACLERCRAPYTRLAAARQPGAPVSGARVGVGHGFACLGSWIASVVVLILAGAVSPALMLVVALTEILERGWRHGRGVSRALGIGLLVLAALVPSHPEWLPALAA